MSSKRWEVILSPSDSFQQISFVNSICTTRGGSHVNYILDQVVSFIKEQIAKVDKKLNIKPAQIKVL
jgi:DNA topoisomerase-2